jgi:uncharacterized membrane protein
MWLAFVLQQIHSRQHSRFYYLCSSVLLVYGHYTATYNRRQMHVHEVMQTHFSHQNEQQQFVTTRDAATKGLLLFPWSVFEVTDWLQVLVGVLVTWENSDLQASGWSCRERSTFLVVAVVGVAG